MGTVPTVFDSHIILNKAASSPVFPGEGGSVFVRVLGKNAAGSLIVSVNGMRFDASSSLKLKAGDSFRAFMSVSDSAVILTPETIPKGAAHGASLSAASAEQFFARTGLPPGDISLRLLGLFRQLGVRINASLAGRAAKLAAAFPGQEAEAAETALLLLEKGIDPSIADISSLLDILGGGRGKKHKKETDSSDGAVLSENTEAGDCGGENVPANLLSSLYADGEEVYNRNPGLLTVLNHLKTVKGTQSRSGGAAESGLHWIMLPYESGTAAEAGSDAEPAAPAEGFRGTIRMLIDYQAKRTEKILVSAFFNTFEWRFLVYFNTHRLPVIEFCRIPAVSQVLQSEAEKSFINCYRYFIKCEIRYNRNLSESGFFSVPDEIPFINVEV